MIGTILNVIAIILGGTIGVIGGNKFPEKLRQSVMLGFGLFTFALGIQMFLKTQNVMVVLASLLFGIILGEWMRIEDGLHFVGKWLEDRFARNTEEGSQGRFVRGFMAASLVYCIGPVAILGSIQDGLTGDYSLLAVKSVLDGFISVAFASTLGIGVAFSALPILVYQGGISLLAHQVQSIATPPVMAEMTAVGGVLLSGVAVSGMLEIKKIRVGNFLPAIFLAPLFVAIFQYFNLL
jgi:uncharacterized protein